jgi:hypothetical protein
MRYRAFHDDSSGTAVHPDACSERSLAAAVLKQAWHEAVMDLIRTSETTRESYSLLKKEAINWISSGGDGFKYWCQLAEVDHTEVQRKLTEVLHSQHHSS